jgi:hypothetical protein
MKKNITVDKEDLIRQYQYAYSSKNVLNDLLMDGFKFKELTETRIHKAIHRIEEIEYYLGRLIYPEQYEREY